MKNKFKIQLRPKFRKRDEGERFGAFANSEIGKELLCTEEFKSDNIVISRLKEFANYSESHVPRDDFEQILFGYLGEFTKEVIRYIHTRRAEEALEIMEKAKWPK